MDEIKVYLDKNKEQDIQGDIEFEGVSAGETSKGKIYIYNTTKYHLDVNLKLEGEYIEMSKTIDRLSPKQTEELEFVFTPKITIMQPIRAKLKIKIEYNID